MWSIELLVHFRLAVLGRIEDVRSLLDVLRYVLVSIGLRVDYFNVFLFQVQYE